MLEKLDEKYPIPGPKFINWNVVITTFVIMFFTFMLTVGNNFIMNLYGVHKKVITHEERIVQLEQHVQESKELTQKVDKVLEMLEMHFEYDRIFAGKAKIGSNGASVGVWLNSESKISRLYKEGDKVCLTSLLEHRTKCGIPILGIVSFNTPMYLLEITHATANEMRIDDSKTECEIRVEPNRESTN